MPDQNDEDALRALLFGVLLWKDADFIRLGTQWCQYRAEVDRLREGGDEGELRKAEEACRGILDQVVDLDRKRR